MFTPNQERLATTFPVHFWFVFLFDLSLSGPVPFSASNAEPAQRSSQQKRDIRFDYPNEWTAAHREQYEKFLIETLSFPQEIAGEESVAEEEQQVFETGMRLSKLPPRPGG